MGIAPEYDLKPTDLTQHFRKLQTLLHPDKFTTKYKSMIIAVDPEYYTPSISGLKRKRSTRTSGVPWSIGPIKRYSFPLPELSTSSS